MATGPSSVGATMDVTTPDRASTPLAVETSDSSDQGSLPAPAYNENDYRFNRTTPGATLYYQPTAITEQPRIIENQTATILHLNDHTHYIQPFTALTLEEYRQTTPLDRLDYSRPLQRIPGDLRKPHYDSTLLSITMAEACDVHYYRTTSFHTTTGHPDHYVVVKLHIEQELLLRYFSSGQLLHFTRTTSPTCYRLPDLLHYLNYYDQLHD